MAKPAEIRPISEIGKHVNFLLHSEPGVGKTPFIATGAKTLILDADSGIDSAAFAGSKADVWTVEDHRTLYDVLEYLKHENHGYKWVWLDSLTLYQEKGLEDVMADLVATKKHRDIDLPDRGEYRLNYGRILRWVRHMSAQPFHFGITTHSMYDEDSEMHVPLIAGQSKNGPMWTKVCGFMGIVGYLRSAKKKDGSKQWVLHLDRNYKDYYARNRYGLDRIVAPTIPKLERAVFGEAPKKKRRRKPVD